MTKINKIAFCVLIAIVMNRVSNALNSDYIANFLKDKIVELLITLMAINTATASIIVTKIEEVSKKYGVNLNTSINEVKQSTVAQIWLVGLSVLTLMLYKSKVVISAFPNSYKDLFDIILLSIFICALDILRDTGMAIFVINEGTTKADNNSKNK